MARLPQVLNASQAARYIGITRETLRRWNNLGEGPPRVRKGKTYWYVKELLREWLDAGATSPPALKAAKFDKGPMSHRT
jgi:predicted site-specific integrase-resolvase